MYLLLCLSLCVPFVSCCVQLELSTKPKKAMGDAALWEVAEGSLRETLDEFAGKGNWRVNAGDGAFYGPKIDIKVHTYI